LRTVLRFIPWELVVVCISRITLRRFSIISINRLFYMEVSLFLREDEVSSLARLWLLKRSLWWVSRHGVSRIS
jgi:hypothetical protein